MGLFGPSKRDIEKLAREYIKVSLHDDDRAMQIIGEMTVRLAQSGAYPAGTTPFDVIEDVRGKSW